MLPSSSLPPGEIYSLEATDIPARHRSRPGAGGAGTLGFTLLELITVMTLLGILLGRLLPASKSLMDRMAVASAREVVVGSFHRVRLEAVARGGATLILVKEPPAVRIKAGGGGRVLQESFIGDGVKMTLSGDRPAVELSFDALGLGRVVSQSLVFRKGEARASLVVSSLGRLRRE